MQWQSFPALASSDVDLSASFWVLEHHLKLTLAGESDDVWIRGHKGFVVTRAISLNSFHVCFQSLDKASRGFLHHRRDELGSIAAGKRTNVGEPDS